MSDKELEVELDLDLDFELDEIESPAVDVYIPEEEEKLPSVYLHVEGLILLRQLKGVVEPTPDLITVPVYAYKNEQLTFVNHVELTSKNILAMHHLGLKTTLVREGKEPIDFSKPEHLVQIIKTLREQDRYSYVDPRLSREVADKEE